MNEALAVTLKIADREVRLKAPAEEEAFLREAARMIREQVQKYRQAGFRDTQEVLSMVALDCLVARLKGDEQARRLQSMVFDKVVQLDKVISPALG